jgi:hypothetical protein
MGKIFLVGEGTPHALIIVPVGVHDGATHSADPKNSGVGK